MADESRYREAGVDLEKANTLVSRIRPLVQTTFHGNVITDIGGFGGLYSVDCTQMKNPVLVSSTDGVGTKLKVAFWADKHDTVGIDLVAMCVNDIVVQGARPLFFLDYLAMGSIDLDRVEAIIRGIVTGCKQANCSLIGGETAEMPGFYSENEYDMAGFAVGLVDNTDIIDGSTIRAGQQVVGLASSGLHSNGYSLVRRIVMDELGLKPDSYLEECGRTVAEELLEPTRIYVDPVLRLLRQFQVKGMAHITGGGFADNVSRILPKQCQAVIDRSAWEMPPVFRFLQEAGKVSQEEMYRVFNCGIGYVMVVGAEDLEDILGRLAGMGYAAFRIGEIVARQPEDLPVRLI
ncbi:phosphoribosylformylglycinamidine cyclo-ligase [Desulfosoma caldarium]|uniref:Phosphoribosylformylglycinamidine cyclo-ligase n=1 Tax=Desulfosoma caldarium TaxID=610254 RepID=A0A3N1UQG8_9BACT|nr:phosphoribosylformylglycinamidine cyclo-ligase [Desulfosoma caldarium]ROQ93362.1 phosphoribosylformylglycinamidine cyclo-ligase [Desulfosoma caldarium]